MNSCYDQIRVDIRLIKRVTLLFIFDYRAAHRHLHLAVRHGEAASAATAGQGGDGAVPKLALRPALVLAIRNSSRAL